MPHASTTRFILVAATLGVALLSACVPPSTQNADEMRFRLRSGPPVRGAADVLTAKEIATLPSTASALDALRLLRPRFLVPHGSPAPNDARGHPAIVYLDGQRVGLADALRTIPVAAIVEVRYLTPSTASLWYAPGHPGGVILVRTRR